MTETTKLHQLYFIDIMLLILIIHQISSSLKLLGEKLNQNHECSLESRKPFMLGLPV